MLCIYSVVCVYAYIYTYIYITYIYNIHAYIIDTYIQNRILAIKKNEIMLFVATWMDLEVIILSAISQRKANII